MLQISAESMARRGRQREAEIGTLTVKCVGGVIEELAGETKEKRQSYTFIASSVL